MIPHQSFFSKNTPTVFGKSRQGNDLTEYAWGEGEDSILFLSGFSTADRVLSEALLLWYRQLELSEEYGGILGDFDLKLLRNRCKARLIPLVNPDLCKINQNGIREITKNTEISENSKNLCINARGVDLNRNFNANWIRFRNKDPRGETGGAFPESEAETAAVTGHLRRSPPKKAVILREGSPLLLYPERATSKELREAIFLGQYGGFSVQCATDTDATPFQWLSDRKTDVLEVHCDHTDPRNPKLRDFFTMCAALI